MKKIAALILLSAVAVACTEEAPTRPATDDESKTAVDPSSEFMVLACTANKLDMTVKCSEPQLGTRMRGPVADIIYGGQNTFVKLTSSNVAYDSGTGRFTFDVTLQNLLQQPIGTTDGTTLAATGVRVFFSSGPTVTGGSGIAFPLPDGFATFTSGGQPFYQYNQVLSNTQTSAAKVWTLIIAPTVETFTFLLLISAPVQYPSGYVEINGNLPGASYGLLHPGSTVPLTGVVKNHLGLVIPGSTITWATVNPDMATVDAGGVVTGVRYGTVAITAVSSTGQNGNLLFDVTGTIRNWTGAVSTDWSTGGNWGGGYTPALVDTANIPTGVPNFPLLTSSQSIGAITVADLATASLGAFNLTLTSIATTGPTVGSGVLATTGVLNLTGVSTFHGRFPNTTITGQYSLTGDAFIVAPLTIDLGLFQTDSRTITIDSQ